jgi:hypothetical protein
MTAPILEREKIMLMVGTVIFFCDASSKLMCEITKH